ncbi:MAG TPA: hypothetical protein VFB13_02090 [Reyranella sp.]|nr:hypothetical protein [Reyranella sp.]
MNLRGYFGLAEPHDPARMLVLVAAGALGVVLTGLTVWLVLAGEFIPGSPREHYLLYLTALIAAGAGFAAKPRVAAALLSLATIDMALGFGSFVMVRAGLAYSDVLPDKYWDPPRFEWHPLLQGVPIPSISRRVVNLTVSHSSAGTRGRDYSAAELRHKTVIAVFGGSTTYDLMVSDDETWPARLEARLGASAYAVINNGVPGYSTAEHVVQTAFYEKKFGVLPRCALYYIGWNDIRNARRPHLDWGFARYHLPSQIDNLQIRRAGTEFETLSPLITIAGRVVGQLADTAVRRDDRPTGTEVGSGDSFDDVVIQNLQTISAINRARGITTIWVPQVLNLAALDRDGPATWVAGATRREVPVLMAAYARVVKREAAALGDLFIELDPHAFGAEDFQDSGHFAPVGSARLAALLAGPVTRACE